MEITPIKPIFPSEPTNNKKHQDQNLPKKDNGIKKRDENDNVPKIPNLGENLDVTV